MSFLSKLRAPTTVKLWLSLYRYFVKSKFANITPVRKLLHAKKSNPLETPSKCKLLQSKSPFQNKAPHRLRIKTIHMVFSPLFRLINLRVQQFTFWGWEKGRLNQPMIGRKNELIVCCFCPATEADVLYLTTSWFVLCETTEICWFFFCYYVRVLT